MMIDDRAPYFKAKAFHKDRFIDIDMFDYRGKWLVLFFYPRDFNFTCLNEIKELTMNYDGLKKMGAEVLSISTDTEFVHKAWHESSDLLSSIKFPMIADPSGAISKSYGTYIEKNGVSAKATFIIDPEGFIRDYEIGNEFLGRSVIEIIRKIHALKYSSKNMQEFCPIEIISERKVKG